MSRYIRTKDGRIIDKERVIKGLELVHLENIQLECCPCDGWYWKDQDGDYELEVGDDEIEREADTIEKLCDRYVLHHTDIIFLNKEHTKYRFENEPNNWYDITDTEIRVGIYGAIWTKKGLIYRAKMNNEGVLELL